MEYIQNDKNSAYDFEKTQNFYNSAYDKLNDKNRDVDKTKELVLSNIYSYKKTKAQNKLLYVIIFVCVLVIIISIINKTQTLVDDNMYAFIIGSILGLTLIYIGYSLWVFSFRDSKNYDEYDYGKFGTINIPAANSNKPTDTDYTSTVDSSNCEVSILKESDKTIRSFFKTL
jgi:hypothetical protein